MSESNEASPGRPPKRRLQTGLDDIDNSHVKSFRADDSSEPQPQSIKKEKRVRFNEQVEKKVIGQGFKASRPGRTTGDDLYKGASRRATVDAEGREMIDKTHHTLDSDEEDEKDHDQLDVRQLEGQEDRTIDFEGDTKIMAFNMDEDMEEGHFDKSGNFIFDKKTEDINDPWYDSVDWTKVKTTEEDDNDEDTKEGEETDQDTLSNRLPSYKLIHEQLRAGETCNDAMKRLNKNRPDVAQERKLRWAAKKAGTPYVDQIGVAIENITAAADVLIKKGDTTIYDMKKEDIQKVIDEANNEIDTTTAKDEGGDLASQLMMDTEDSEVTMWEYKLPNEDNAKIASTKDMMDMKEAGTLPNESQVRRVGTETFYSAGRIEFEDYLD